MCSEKYIQQERSLILNYPEALVSPSADVFERIRVGKASCHLAEVLSQRNVRDWRERLKVHRLKALEGRIGTSALNPSAFSLQPSAFSLQPSAFSLQPSAFSLQPSAFSL